VRKQANPESSKPQTLQRKARLAEALKANLKRRKDKAKQLVAPTDSKTK
jgi:hypothetical protein